MINKLSKRNIIMLVLFALLIVFVIVFCVLYNKNIAVKTFADEYIFKKNIEEDTLSKIFINDNSYYYSFNDNIVVLNQNVLTFYNRSGSEISNLEINISEPIFSSNGKYLCIAEKNGPRAYLINNKNIIWQKSIDGNISCACVNKNGYVAVAISDTTYKTIGKVFNESGAELFTNYLSKSYIIDLSLSDDNNHLAIAEANFSGISIQSNIKIISIDKALSNSGDIIEFNYTAPSGNFIVNISYCDNNNLVCIYDNHVDIIKDNVVNDVSNFENDNILFADINNKLIQIEKKNSGLLSSEFELQIIDVNSLEKKIYILEKEPKSLNVYGNVIAINFGVEALFINNSSWLIKQYKASQEIKDIIISNNLAGIIYKDKIEFVNL